MFAVAKVIYEIRARHSQNRPLWYHIRFGDGNILLFIMVSITADVCVCVLENYLKMFLWAYNLT
jgi:hypothetical protein